MRPRTLWPDDPVFLEIGVRDAGLADGLRREGYSKYLGVSGDGRRVARLQRDHPELADHLTFSQRRKLVLNNNADVLLLSGATMMHVWKYRAVRHAKWVAWPCSVSPLSLLALLGCFWHMLTKRYGWPRVVGLSTAAGATRRIFASRVKRQKLCRSHCLHFAPHSPGVEGLFRQFAERNVRYVVLRWFDSLPEIGPGEDIDLLIDDRCLDAALEIFAALPGIQPCDVYSETGLARSAYRGTPYYPAHVARRLLDGAELHNDLCLVPNARDYFHSLAYHAVYHKGTRSNLPRTADEPANRGRSRHDFVLTLRRMANELGIDVEISLEGLHDYLQESGWGPSPEMLARLAVADWRNEWLQVLAERLDAHVLDEGLTVFVLRQEAIERDYQELIVRMIRESGFEILATRSLAPEEVEYAAARTRGGNWEAGGPFQSAGGPPAVAVVAYDSNPLPLNRKQRRRFPERTNARIFVKESIRDAIVSQLPPEESFNALHSSDNAPEAWHLIEVLAPELVDSVRTQLREIHAAAEAEPLRKAA